MMRIFVYEYTCAAPPALLKAGGAASLSTEGEAMLQAVVADFSCVPGIDAFTIRHEHDEEAAFHAAARSADWSLVIAPEFHDNLYQRCCWVLEVGGKLLGPSPDAVKLCGDKLALYRWLDSRAVPIPETRSAIIGVRSGWHGPFVRKPRFGAGSQDTTLIDSDIADVPLDGAFGEVIEQQYVRGFAASVAFLCGAKTRLELPACSQLLSSDGRFAYLGGRAPLPAGFAKRALRIARQAVDAVPGLFGYVGVDVVLGDDGQDWVIEINPRLTTSYIGLRALAESNLAEAMLRVAEGNRPSPPAWRAGGVEFLPDGTTHFRSAPTF
jgi:predicted ATP-grasp superfamily ATP-dependent carboligase